MGNLMGKISEIGTLLTQHRMPPLCERADASKLHGSTWNFARTQLRLWGVVLCSRHAKKRMPENRRSILVSWVIFEIRHTLNLSLQLSNDGNTHHVRSIRKNQKRKMKITLGRQRRVPVGLTPRRWVSAHSPWSQIKLCLRRRYIAPLLRKVSRTAEE